MIPHAMSDSSESDHVKEYCATVVIEPPLSKIPDPFKG